MCGKSRGGASVPLCVKLQGAVVCGKPQHQSNGTGCTCPAEYLERSGAEENRPCCPLTSVCKSNGLNPEKPSSGKVFYFFIMLGQRGIKNTQY